MLKSEDKESGEVVLKSWKDWKKGEKGGEKKVGKNMWGVVGRKDE